MRSRAGGIAGLAACGCLACSTADPTLPDLRLRGGLPSARAYRLGSEGPFIDHEMAAARSGDVVIENDEVRFIVTGGTENEGYVPFAGTIIDAALQPRSGHADYDGVDGFYPLVNLSPIAASRVTIERDGSDGAAAVLRVAGPLSAAEYNLGVQGAEPRALDAWVELDYSLEPASHALELRTQVLSQSQHVEQVEIGDVVLFGDDEAEPFTLPAGFDQNADTEAPEVIGSSHETRAQSYAIYALAGPLELVAGSTVQDQLSGDGSLVGYDVASALLEPGHTLEATRFLSIAPDIDGAIAPRLALQGRLTAPLVGVVSAGGSPVAGARVSVFSDATLASLVSQTVSGAAGAFELELEPGRYSVVATGRTTGERVELPNVQRELAEGYAPSALQEVTVGAGSEPVELELGPPAHLVLEVRTADGAATPGKVTFQAEDARHELIVAAGERAPYTGLGVRQVVWTPNGDAELDLEPGVYTVSASHGPNAELDVRHGVLLAEGETTRLSLRIREPIAHAGYVAVDSHVHGVYSQHGEATSLERLVTAAAQGLDVFVATDHDVIADYSAGLASVGLASVLTSISGVEFKTVNGDHCAWPLRRSPTEPMGGARRWWLTDRDIETQYRYYAERGAIVTQVAHGTSHFRSAGYDLATGSVSRPERFSFGFNAMEVHNGGGGGGRSALLPIWMSLIDFGHRVAPVAVSDSHGRIPEVGVARTYVRVDSAARQDPDAIARATAELHTVASTGPFIALRTEDGAGPGDTRSISPSQPLELLIEVWAPSWMPLDEVRLLAGGHELARWDATTDPPLPATSQDGLWLQERVLVQPAVDEWYAVETSGAADLAPVYPGVKPWAITAPLFVDADGDGEFRARCVRQSCAAP